MTKSYDPQGNAGMQGVQERFRHEQAKEKLAANRARELAMRIACAAFDFMPNYSWGEQTTDEVHGAIQTAAYKTLMEAES